MSPTLTEPSTTPLKFHKNEANQSVNRSWFIDYTLSQQNTDNNTVDIHLETKLSLS